jgi:hypothetical protein
MLDEDRQQVVGRLDELVLRFLRRLAQKHALVGDAGAVMDAVVDREPLAHRLEHGPGRGLRDQLELRDDQPFEEDLHHEDLLLERVGPDHERRHLVEVGVAPPSPPACR